MKTKSHQGFTLAELLVVITLFTTVMLIASSLYTRFSSAERKLSAENNLYEETRFTLERIVKEFREGTIDYEEYWNQANSGDNCVLYSTGSIANGDYSELYSEEYGPYGNCYKGYANQFYNPADGLNTGQNPYDADDSSISNAISTSGDLDYKQDELYIINNSGNRKTLLRCFQCDTDLNNNPGKLQILSLNGHDIGYDDVDVRDKTNNDGIVDTWVCGKDYQCSGSLSNGTSAGEFLTDNNDGWVDYSPSSLDITDLQFYIAPLEDPRKAYNENDASIQMQPHITIIISAQTSKKQARGFPGKTPTATLQTTVSGRVFNEVR